MELSNGQFRHYEPAESPCRPDQHREHQLQTSPLVEEQMDELRAELLLAEILFDVAAVPYPLPGKDQEAKTRKASLYFVAEGRSCTTVAPSMSTAELDR